jgi:uncharacterized protein
VFHVALLRSIGCTAHASENAALFGDIPAILDRLAPDVAWEAWDDNFSQRAAVPHLVGRSGPDDVAGFFAVLGSYTVLEFAVLDIIGTGRQVVAEVRGAFEVPGGGRFADEELHLWTFDDEGRSCASGTTWTRPSTSRPHGGRTPPRRSGRRHHPVVPFRASSSSS